MRNNPNLLLSVILPMFNEAEILLASLSKVVSMLEQISNNFEIICVNDGSTDETEKLIRKEANRDHRIRGVTLSKNFGKESAIIAGLDSSLGAAIIVMDSDLQHPPHLLPKMLQHWKEGYDIVECQKINRGKESFLYKACATAFNRFISNATGADMRGASDFKLLDRKVVDALKSLPEHGRFFRGLVSWVGFESIQVPFEVEPRLGGQTTWSKISLVKYAFNNIFAFTNKPLIWTACLGGLITLFGALLGLQTLWNFFCGLAVSGFTTVILCVIFFSGIIILSIGIVAVYVGRIFDEVKNRPTYILKYPSGEGNNVVTEEKNRN